MSEENLFEVLARSRRRNLIRELNQREETTLREAADAIAAIEEPGELSFGDRQKVYTGLLQSHVPLLEEYGVVEMTGQEKQLRRGPAFDEARAVLHAADAVLE